jgi:hypothetical protein
MPKVNLKTTLRNQKELGGLATEGSEKQVSKEYAEELVEKGYAEFVEGSKNLVETNRGEYHEDFLSTELPEDFPSEEVHSILTSDNVYNFAALLSYENFEDINGIGPTYAEEIEEGVEIAYDEWNEKVNQ